MKQEHKLSLVRIAVIAARIIVGCTFIISGWAKAIDPWGFIIKVGEYLTEWDWTVPHEAIAAGCVSLAIAEFTTGVLMLTGCLRRVTVWVALAFMTGMLPLTLYIALYNPVADCGCFGDFLIISNWATFWKNVALTALIVFLLFENRRVGGLYPAASQWLVITATVAFPLLLSISGYRVQPLLDFRPYKVGTTVFASSDDDTGNDLLLYEKDGQRRRFGLDELPDSSWTFVEEASDAHDFGTGISVYDESGDDVSQNLSDRDGAALYLIVTEPDPHRLTYDHLINTLATECNKAGINFDAVVGTSGEELNEWKDWRRPQYDVYSADGVALKQLVRGTQALVYTEDGTIRWKMSIQSFDRELALHPDQLASILPPDSGRTHNIFLAVYLGALLAILIAAQGINSAVRQPKPKQEKAKE